MPIPPHIEDAVIIKHLITNENVDAEIPAGFAMNVFTELSHIRRSKQDSEFDMLREELGYLRTYSDADSWLKSFYPWCRKNNVHVQ
jgi:hypothetical protein